MAAFEYILPAVQGTQAGREYFVTMCPLALVPRLFPAEEVNLRPELSAQRVVNKGRVPEIARYLTAHPTSYVLPALLASIDGEVQFEQLPAAAAPTSLGYLKVPMTARLLLHDGLHRREAIGEALKARPELGQETVSLILFVDPGLQRAEQMFTDLKRNETRSARSQSILCDNRDEMARLVKALVGRVEVFTGLTEMIRSKISNRAAKLFTLSSLYHATTTLLSDRQGESFTARLNLAIAFWSEVAANIPDWQRAKTGEVSPGELRKKYVHAHAIALAALARAGKDLLARHPKAWKQKLRALRTVDWSRDNTRLWEGRAMIAGRLSKASTCVMLTGNAIKQCLGLSLTSDEQRAEDQLRARN